MFRAVGSKRAGVFGSGVTINLRLGFTRIHRLARMPKAEADSVL